MQIEIQNEQNMLRTEEELCKLIKNCSLVLQKET